MEVEKRLVEIISIFQATDAVFNKFRNSILVPPEEKPDKSTILQYVIGDPKGPPVNGQFPTDGVKTT